MDFLIAFFNIYIAECQKDYTYKIKAGIQYR
jgi:hypothetical protein